MKRINITIIFNFAGEFFSGWFIQSNKLILIN